MKQRQDMDDFDKIIDQHERSIQSVRAKEEFLRQNDLQQEKERAEKIHKQIRDTGIISLMQEVADSGRVRLLKREIGSRKFIKAEITIYDKTPEIVMKFNEDTPGGDLAWDEVRAMVINGLLVIRGEKEYVVGNDMSMGKALGLAVANPIHEYRVDRSWS
jgi:hypothetical protein